MTLNDPWTSLQLLEPFKALYSVGYYTHLTDVVYLLTLHFLSPDIQCESKKNPPLRFS